jgi:hypothetical protein
LGCAWSIAARKRDRLLLQSLSFQLVASYESLVPKLPEFINAL